jgi:hypothetical protein
LEEGSKTTYNEILSNRRGKNYVGWLVAFLITIYIHYITSRMWKEYVEPVHVDLPAVLLK